VEPSPQKMCLVEFWDFTSRKDEARCCIECICEWRRELTRGGADGWVGWLLRMDFDVGRRHVHAVISIFDCKHVQNSKKKGGQTEGERTEKPRKGACIGSPISTLPLSLPPSYLVD